MAQQIQFIYLTQSDYNNLTPQTNKIYFTSDTKRIYKGSDLYAATTFDQLNFNSIEASSITVDGDPVSVEGHTHVMSEITDLDTTAFASSTHTHPELSGLTSSSITKDTGTFTNLVVTNASLDATSITASGVEVNGEIQASTVSASSATFQTLTVTGEVTMSLSSVDFQNINASSLTVNGSAVSLEGHSHSASEISGLDAAISAATSSFALTGHTHVVSEITDFDATAFASSNHTHPELSGLTSSTITKETGTFTNLVVASASFTATNVEAEEISASTATFGDINVTGTASLNATHVSASTLTADSGTFTNLTVVSASFEATSIEASAIVTSSITVGGSAVALVGHTHPASEVTGLQSVLDGLSSTYASISHVHAISDITNLSTILTGITESGIEKDTVTADIGYFRLLSVSGSANFAVNTVSANAVTVNGTEVALSGHTHSVADIDGLSTALSGFASSGHTHEELTGITQTSISKANGNFGVLTASTATFTNLTVSTATFDVEVIDTSSINVVYLTASNLNITNNLEIVGASVSALNVEDLNVSGSMLYNNKEVATQEYVQQMISVAIGQVLASQY